MNLTQDFIHGSTKKSLAAMVLPLLIAMVLNMAYNLVDSLWIGNLLGETAYAALTNATPLILILNAIAMGATNGVAILLSQAVGAGDRFRSARLITTSLVVAVVFALGLTLILELTLTPLLLLLQTPAEIFSLTHSYLAIYILGYLPVYLYCYFAAVMRSYGNSVFQVIAMLICTLLNAGLDPLFIHFMGFDGAAVATLLSQTLCLFCMLGYLHRKPLFSLHLSQFDGSLGCRFYPQRYSFCFSAEHSSNQHELSHRTCQQLWYFGAGSLRHHREIENDLILSSNGAEHGAYEHCRTMRRRKTLRSRRRLYQALPILWCARSDRTLGSGGHFCQSFITPLCRQRRRS